MKKIKFNELLEIKLDVKLSEIHETGNPIEDKASYHDVKVVIEYSLLRAGEVIAKDETHVFELSEKEKQLKKYPQEVVAMLMIEQNCILLKQDT